MKLHLNSCCTSAYVDWLLETPNLEIYHYCKNIKTCICRFLNLKGQIYAVLVKGILIFFKSVFKAHIVCDQIHILHQSCMIKYTNIFKGTLHKPDKKFYQHKTSLHKPDKRVSNTQHYLRALLSCRTLSSFHPLSG